MKTDIFVTNIVDIDGYPCRIIGKTKIGFIAGFVILNLFTGRQSVIRRNNGKWEIIG